MQSVTYPHLEDEVTTPPSPPRDWGWTLGRVGAFVIGASTVWIQVHYTWATLPDGDMAMRAAPVLFAVSLAASLVAVEGHYHRGQYLKAIGWFIAFIILGACNLQTTGTRVAEVRALKAAEGKSAGEIQRDAKDALGAARNEENDARMQVREYCGNMVKTTTTATEPTGKKKATRTTNKTEASVDPRCNPARVTLTDAEQKTQLARAAVANSAISASTDGISPAAKSVSGLTGWNEVTVDQSMNFIQPVGLDVLALIAFLTAFSGNSRPARPVRRREKSVASASTNSPAAANGANLVVKGIPQPTVNTLVEKWISETGLPIDMGMGACLKNFTEWAELPETAVSFVTFGRAFDALGIERRSLGGRKIVAGRRAIR